MDFMQRGGHANQTPTRSVSPTETAAPSNDSKGSRRKDSKLFRIGSVVLLFFLTALIISITALLMVSRSGSSAEQDMVKTDRLQAVFLNGGQVYFGNIGDMNRGYITLSNIYYLRVNQQVQPNQSQEQASQEVTLAKLGCELHGPEDKMVINREQVMFWENLKTDGQVAEAVKKFVSENPQGQKCAAPAAATTEE